MTDTIPTTIATHDTTTPDGAAAWLREALSGQWKIYTSVVHVTASGMSRDIMCLIVIGDEIHNVSWLVARAVGWRIAPRNSGMAVRVKGVGMDMTYHLVYTLSQCLYGAHEGYKLKRQSL